jgi:preprotein translocase subunit YajC
MMRFLSFYIMVIVLLIFYLFPFQDVWESYKQHRKEKEEVDRFIEELKKRSEIV